MYGYLPYGYSGMFNHPDLGPFNPMQYPNGSMGPYGYMGRGLAPNAGQAVPMPQAQVPDPLSGFDQQPFPQLTPPPSPPSGGMPFPTLLGSPTVPGPQSQVPKANQQKSPGAGLLSGAADSGGLFGGLFGSGAAATDAAAGGAAAGGAATGGTMAELWPLLFLA